MSHLLSNVTSFVKCVNWLPNKIVIRPIIKVAVHEIVVFFEGSPTKISPFLTLDVTKSAYI